MDARGVVRIARSSWAVGSGTVLRYSSLSCAERKPSKTGKYGSSCANMIWNVSYQITKYSYKPILLTKQI